ncbi:MAG: PQQ-dependent sugar dehydrogenase [Xanthomonadales bacterium]|nr:PQQ-dependent sugar dehydrogenase [Xanthomonadales bacterium]
MTWMLWLSLVPLVWADYVPDQPIQVPLVELFQGLDGEVDGTAQIFPTDLAAFPDDSGRLLVTTLGGVLRLVDAAGNLQAIPYLDTFSSDTINASNGNASFGLTTVAFHPEFANSSHPGAGRFYTIEPEVTRTSPPPDFPGVAGDQGGSNPAHDRVLYEYTVTQPIASVFQGNRREVLRIHEHRRGHDVNDLDFDGQGLLYIAVGDTVVGETAQDLGNVFGTILRIDPLHPDDTPGSPNPASANGQYRLPLDNPFMDEPGVVEEVFAYGLRNPFRIHYDQVARTLWVSSNGLQQRESVYRVANGDNLGWPFFEGTRMNSSPPPGFSFTPPVFEYDHGIGVSVTGLMVYRGTRFPELFERVIFSDFLGAGSGVRLFYGDPVSGEFGDLIRSEGANLPSALVSVNASATGEMVLLGGDGRVLTVGIADRLFGNGFE